MENNRDALSICSITMRFTPDQVEKALQLLRSATGRIMAKPSCRWCRVMIDADDACLVRHEEYWNAEEDLGQNIRSEAFRPILAAIDLCTEPPEILIGSLAAQSGMEALHRLWAAGDPRPLFVTDQ